MSGCRLETNPIMRRMFLLALILLPVFMHMSGAAVQARESERILIQNVTLIDKDDQEADVIVNILVKDRKLEVVTQDEISTDKVSLAFDARQGYLIGRLTLGQQPSFMILDGDPRNDIQILLDTDSHARFAMQEGIIVRNRLDRARDIGKEPKQTGWFAYSPPPLSLPIDYESGSRWNQWKTKWISGIFIGTLALDSQYWPYQNDASEQQVGDLSDYVGGEIRTLRMGMVGTLNFESPWVYTLFAATHAFDKGFDTDDDNTLSLLDWRLDIPLWKQTSLALGKQKELISMERISSLAYLPWQERSAPADAFLPARNVGVALSGTVFDQRATWAGGVYNDWFDTGKTFDESTNHYVGRLTWLPYIKKKEDALLHLGFGLRYSDAREEVRFRTTPEFHNSPVFVDTGVMDADGALAYTAEASWRMGPFWLGSEYIRSWVNAPELGDPVFDGYHISGSWVVTGEMRRYNKKNGTLERYPVARSVYQGGAGAWETAVRWSSLNLDDAAVDGGKMDIFSLGVNWWLSSFFLTSVNYRHIVLEDDGLTGISDGVNIRIMLILE